MPKTRSKLPIVVLSFVNLILLLSTIAMRLFPYLSDGRLPGTPVIVDACVSSGCALLFVIFCFLINKAPGINFIPEAILVTYDIGYQLYYSFEFGLPGRSFFIYSLIFVGFVIIYGLAMTGKFGYSAAGRVLIIIFGLFRIGYAVISPFRFLEMRDLMNPSQEATQIINAVRGVLLVITMIMCVFHASKRRPQAEAQPSTAQFSVQSPAQAAPYPVERNEFSFGYWVLCFFFPLVGLILYIVWHDTTPLKARSCGIGALVGFIVSLVLTLIFVAVYVLLIMAAFN